MTLSAQSLEWAAQFVADHSDGDLFPRIAEISAIIAANPSLRATRRRNSKSGEAGSQCSGCLPVFYLRGGGGAQGPSPQGPA